MTRAKTGREWLNWGKARLFEAGIDEPLAAKLLLLNAFDWDNAQFILNEYDMVTDVRAQAFEAYIQRRCDHEPVSHILGEVSFMGLSFKSDERALTPRNDSERLVEAALDFADAQSGTIIDLGTGSGCLLLSFLTLKPDWRGIGVDIDAEALRLAGENAERLDVSGRVQFIKGNWADAAALLNSANIIISNPPYIRSDVVKGLEPEVLEFDPHIALDGGEDGLDAYRALLDAIAEHAKPGAAVLMEIGFDQADELKRLSNRSEFAEFTVLKDFSGHNRVVRLKKT